MKHNRKVKQWSFSDVAQQAAAGLSINDRLSVLSAMFHEMIPTSTPQQLSSLLALTIGVTRRSECYVLLSQLRNTAKHDASPWVRWHTVWRYEVFRVRMYIERIEQLYAIGGRDASKIGIVNPALLSNFLMNAAFSAVVGEDVAADWVGERCLRLFEEPPQYVSKDAFTLGPVAPFILLLYCLWRGRSVSLKQRGVILSPPFQDVINAWNDPEALDWAVLQLCELHSRKAANCEVPNDDLVLGLQAAPHKDFPTEVLFIQRIRRDMGLTIPNPDHPLLRSPLIQMPFPCPKSGYDPWIAESLEKVRADMPDLRIEWEEEYQKLGPSDPRSLPTTDFPVD